MIYTVVYGSLLLIALLMAWGSRAAIYQQLGALMLLSWLVYNIVVRAFGFPHGLLIDALADALIATAAAGVGLRHRSAAAFGVVLLFVAEECWHLTASMTGQETSTLYHKSLNVIFALQVLIIGGGAGVALARHWRLPHPRGLGAHYLLRR